MQKPSEGYFRKVLGSFVFAGRGIRLFLSKPSNAWIHVAAAIVVCLAGFAFHISRYEWLALILAISGVFVAELINSAIENLTDMVSPAYNVQAGKVKDLAAGAVLVAAIGALIVGLVIFLPKFFPVL